MLIFQQVNCHTLGRKTWHGHFNSAVIQLLILALAAKIITSSMSSALIFHHLIRAPRAAPAINQQLVTLMSRSVSDPTRRFFLSISYYF